MEIIGDYTIRYAETDDLPGVTEVMRENFYYEETVFKSLISKVTLTEEERKVLDDNLNATIRRAFESSRSLVAVHNETRKIVGVGMTAINKNPRFGEAVDGITTMFSTDGPKSPLFEQYYKYMSDLDRKMDLFGKYPDIEFTLECYAVAVDKDHRRKGVSQELVLRGLLHAKTTKVPLAFAVCTSPYAVMSGENAGMRKILEIDLLDYLDENNQPIFADTVPHNTVSVLVLEVFKMNKKS